MKTKTIVFLITATVAQSLIHPMQASQPEVLYEFQQGPAFPEARLVGR